MENKILEILQEVAMGAKTAFAAKEEIMILVGDLDYPSWLDKEEFEFSKELYKESKIQGIKYLLELSRPHKDNPLRWSKEFLERVC